MKKFNFLILLSSLTTSLLFSNSITIYDNFALINNNITIPFIKKGIYNYDIKDISDNFIQNSFTFTFNKNITLLEKEYSKNNFNFNHLISSFINKNLKYYDRNNNILNGKLISIYNNNTSLVSSMNSIEIVNNNNIIIDNISKDIQFNPSLSIKLKSNKNMINTPIHFSYLTKGFSWISNYILTLSNNTMNIENWATIKNNTSSNIINSNLILFTGKTHKIHNHKPLIRYKSLSRSTVTNNNNNNNNNIKSNKISSFYIYKVPFPITLNKKSEKQILLFNKNINIYNQYYSIDLKNVNSSKEFKFNTMISFKNNKENNAHIIFPSGIVRVYKTFKKQKIFLGESYIHNTPLNNTIKIIIGTDYDSFGKVTLTERYSNNTISVFKYLYSISNNSNIQKTYFITQSNPFYNSNNTINTYCNNNINCKLIDTNNKLKIKYRIIVKPHTHTTWKTSFTKKKI